MTEPDGEYILKRVAVYIVANIHSVPNAVACLSILDRAYLRMAPRFDIDRILSRFSGTGE